MPADIKDYFLATAMDKAEFVKVQYTHIPDDIQIQYNLTTKAATDNYIYIQIKNDMQGLKQVTILAYNHLKSFLAPYRYIPVQGTVSIWKHKTRPTKFCLCVDDFGTTYISKSNAEYLLNAIGTKYKYTTDWDGKNYCGLAINWSYEEGYVDISMSDYVKKHSADYNMLLKWLQNILRMQMSRFSTYQKCTTIYNRAR